MTIERRYYYDNNARWLSLQSPPRNHHRRRCGRLMLLFAIVAAVMEGVSSFSALLTTTTTRHNNQALQLLLPYHHHGSTSARIRSRQPLHPSSFSRHLGNHHHQHHHRDNNNCRITSSSAAAAAAAQVEDELWQQEATVAFSNKDAASADSAASDGAITTMNNDYSYRSSLLFSSEQDWNVFVDNCRNNNDNDDNNNNDLFWKQIKLEAIKILNEQPEAGPQLYQGIISQSSLLEAICTCIAHQIETELIPATEVKNLFLSLLKNNPNVIHAIRCDLQAVPQRSPSIHTAMEALLFSNGFHALVCYRVGHLLWQSKRTGLAYYMQSTVSRKYSADIHPACRMGYGIYLRVGSGVVIGETATVGNDVSILEGVTLGGTGKEAGDRHPKVGNGVILQSSSAVLGNIPVGDGAVIMAKSIVTKPVPPLALVSGVPARVVSTRDLDYDRLVHDDLQEHLAIKYLPKWLEIAKQQEMPNKLEQKP